MSFCFYPIVTCFTTTTTTTTTYRLNTNSHNNSNNFYHHKTTNNPMHSNYYYHNNYFPKQKKYSTELCMNMNSDINKVAKEVEDADTDDDDDKGKDCWQANTDLIGDFQRLENAIQELRCEPERMQRLQREKLDYIARGKRVLIPDLIKVVGLPLCFGVFYTG